MQKLNKYKICVIFSCGCRLIPTGFCPIVKYKLLLAKVLFSSKINTLPPTSLKQFSKYHSYYFFHI